MSTFKELNAASIGSSATTLSQLVDVVGADISGSANRKTYEVFSTGGVGPGVVSSIFQTVYDQDSTLVTANAVMDMTIGIFSGSNTVLSSTLGSDAFGKLLFPSTSLMMREKINNYRQYAQLCLGDADNQFVAPFGSTSTTSTIDEAIIISFKRLFSRDGIKRETFAMRMFATGVLDGRDIGQPDYSNIDRTSTSGSMTMIDIGSSTAREGSLFGGVGSIVSSADVNNTVGLIFYEPGIVILDAKKVMSASQHVSGVINGMSSATYKDAIAGETIIGDPGSGNPHAKFIPDLFVSASIDDIVKHIASTRFNSSALTSMITFQNATSINSTIINVNADASSFNLSSNPTFTDENGQIIMSLVDETAKPFTMITGVGLYDANNNLLAVGKLSRPIEKNGEKAINLRLRIDY
jgi:hypothetical protein